MEEEYQRRSGQTDEWRRRKGAVAMRDQRRVDEIEDGQKSVKQRGKEVQGSGTVQLLYSLCVSLTWLDTLLDTLYTQWDHRLLDTLYTPSDTDMY